MYAHCTVYFVGQCSGDGIYPDPSDCTKFFQCMLSIQYSRACPEGTYFDPYAKICGFNSNHCVSRNEKADQLEMSRGHQELNKPAQKTIIQPKSLFPHIPLGRCAVIVIETSTLIQHFNFPHVFQRPRG